jgi:hypothetical protein
MIRQSESRSPQQWAKPSWRKDGSVAPVHRTAAASPKRGVFVPEKGPTFLKVYVIPVLLLNLAFVGWDVVAAHVAPGMSTYLGYAVIVTVSLYLYLVYLDRYLH